MLQTIQILHTALPLGVLTVLILKYLRCHDKGLLWLIVALIAWPILSKLFASWELSRLDTIMTGGTIECFPLNLVSEKRISYGDYVVISTHARSAIGWGVLLLAVTQLNRKNK